MVTTDLKIKPEDKEWTALGNIEFITIRMQKQSKQLRQFCDSRFFIDTARNIISDFEELKKEIEQVKLADDRATAAHNRLYGDPKK